MFFGVARVVSMWVTFRPQLGLQAWFMRRHQMVKVGSCSWYLEGAAWRIHFALGDWGSHTTGLHSLKAVFSRNSESLSPSPQGQPFWSSQRNPWGISGHSKMGGWDSSQDDLKRKHAVLLGIWSAIQISTSSSKSIAEKKEKKNPWLPASWCTGSFNFSRSFLLHIARVVFIHEDCNFNLPGIHPPDDCRRHLGNVRCSVGHGFILNTPQSDGADEKNFEKSRCWETFPRRAN